MDKLTGMKVFTSVAKAGSFVGGAKEKKFKYDKIAIILFLLLMSL
jgi:hypothetical protein